MQAFFQKIVSFFMAILAFFGIGKTPTQPTQPEPPAQRPVKYVAHRGATFAAPENTLPAFAYAAEDGCVGVELDVRRTQDGVLVLSHNAEVKGMLNGVRTSRSISGSTYEALCELSLGQDAAYGEIRVPTLRQALELLYAKGLEAAIHCKEQNGDFLRQVAQTVAACGMSGRCAYNTDKNFDFTIPAVLGEDPAAAFHVPYDTALADDSLQTLVSGPAAIIVTVKVSDLTDRTAARIREKGYSFYIWNVNADKVTAALSAAPDYIEFVSGVRVAEIAPAA